MKKYTLLSICLLVVNFLYAQKPNFSEHVAPILYANCTQCHRTGAIAPFTLESYDDAYNNAHGIEHAVENREMPPWPADPTYRRYAHERLLTEAEIKTIKDWVADGAPEGDPSKAPAKPVFPAGSQLGKADLSVQIPTYTVTSAVDEYRCFALPGKVLDQKYISGLEFMPANRKVVHHILLFYDTTGQCLKQDNNDPLPGYAGFGGVGSNFAVLLGGWVPGSGILRFPKGTGERLPKNADIVIQVHYAPGSNGEKDSTAVNFLYSDAPKVREIFMAPALNHYTSMLNGPLVIPANEIKDFTERYTVPIDVSLLYVTPHMHNIGRKIKVYAVQGVSDTMPLIRINNWDFHWQGSYALQKVQPITKGTRLFAKATYDNTMNNPHQPNNPPKLVKVGEATTDEMMLVYLSYMRYEPGDENMILDSSLINNTDVQQPIAPEKQLSIYPNPAGERLNIRLPEGISGRISIQLTDIQGRVLQQSVVQKPQGGAYVHTLQVGELAAGSYLCRVVYEEGVMVEKVMVKR